MSTTRTSGRALRTALAAGAVALAAHAQEVVSVSQNYVATAQAVMTAGGTSSSASFTAHQGLGQLTTGYVATSSGFVLLGGVVYSSSSAPPPPPGPPPFVAQVVPPGGMFPGGTLVTVLGGNFAAAGAGLPTVLFDGVAGSAVTVIDDTKLTVVVPPGIEIGTGNPKGPVDVEVIDTFGSDILEAGYTFHPSCTLNPPSPKLGKPAQVEAKSGTGGGLLGQVAGGPSLGFGIPIGGFTGSLTLIPQFTVVPPTTPVAGTLVQSFVATDPGLIGVTLDIQAVFVFAIVPFLDGGFSNRVTFQIQP